MLSGKFTDITVLVYSQHIIYLYSNGIVVESKYRLRLHYSIPNVLDYISFVLFSSHGASLGPISVSLCKYHESFKMPKTEQNIFRSLTRGYLQEYHTANCLNEAEVIQRGLKVQISTNRCTAANISVNFFELLILPILPIAQRLFGKNMSMMPSKKITHLCYSLM